jgi:hypothetical protein
MRGGSRTRTQEIEDRSAGLADERADAFVARALAADVVDF